MKRNPGALRIIGGAFRSRLIEFEGASGVRPTPDRVRQTLFDWLAPIVEDSRCLDLFAGSGALGFEALSRGAEYVDFVDIGRTQAKTIEEGIGRLRVEGRAKVSNVDGIAFLSGVHPKPFDIVFLDPPYDSRLIEPALDKLPPLLKPVNRIYFEREHGDDFALPTGYELLKEKKAGQVSYGLATFNGVPE